MCRNRSIDLERQLQRGPAILRCHHRLGPPAHRIQERLDLQAQRLTRLDRDLA